MRKCDKYRTAYAAAKKRWEVKIPNYRTHMMTNITNLTNQKKVCDLMKDWHEQAYMGKQFNELYGVAGRPIYT